MLLHNKNDTINNQRFNLVITSTHKKRFSSVACQSWIRSQNLWTIVEPINRLSQPKCDGSTRHILCPPFISLSSNPDSPHPTRSEPRSSFSVECKNQLRVASVRFVSVTSILLPDPSIPAFHQILDYRLRWVFAQYHNLVWIFEDVSAGCGTVGREVDSDIRDSRFESCHRLQK